MGPLDSLRMGVGYQKDQVIRELELSVPPTNNLWKGEGEGVEELEIKL